MLKNLVVFTLTLFLVGCATLSYKESINSWDSYEDVAKWLQLNFIYEKVIGSRLVRNPENLYRLRSGNCIDAANFATTTLNRINPNYNAGFVFIKNSVKGGPHHWATVFQIDGRIYVMDFGTGKAWKPMQGIHGPYDTLDGYKKFLENLNIPRFKVKRVNFQKSGIWDAR